MKMIENVHELAVSMGNIVINHQIWRYVTQFSDRPISLIIVYETGILYDIIDIMFVCLMMMSDCQIALW